MPIELPLSSTTTSEMTVTEVDVLIVGAGPAGLMLATWLSKLKIKTKIIDKRHAKIFRGQADGVQCRTVEIFQSFGIAHQLVTEGSHINEVCFYGPAQGGGIQRTARVADTLPGTSRCPHLVLTQGRIERLLLDAMERFDGLEVDRAIMPEAISVDPSLVDDIHAHAITVNLVHLTEMEATPASLGSSAVPNGLERSNLFVDELKDVDEALSATRFARAGQRERVKAKFVVGCDGARSWVRQQIPLELKGETGNTYWGVADMYVVTNFPDWRKKCTVHSEKEGSILMIPRENGINRMYAQLGTLQPGERAERDLVTPEKIIDKLRRILAPYTIEVKEVLWWTCYEIGQRMCDKVTADNRVFLSGDAWHLHSPKSGQGMNISMADSYNLGWKLASVLHGHAHRSILETYQTERHATAVDLVTFDRQFAKLFSGKPATPEEKARLPTGFDLMRQPELTWDHQCGVNLEEFKDVFVQAGKWASGTAVAYKSSLLVGSPCHQGMAFGLAMGTRLESLQVLCLADSRPWQLADRLTSDGRWRIIIFAGDILQGTQHTKLQELDEFLVAGPLKMYTPTTQDPDSVIEVLTVLSSSKLDAELSMMPDILWPPKGRHGCRDYEKVFVDDRAWDGTHGRLYENLGICKTQGCVAIVRPDQHVASITPIHDHQSISDFFSSFMIAQQF